MQKDNNVEKDFVKDLNSKLNKRKNIKDYSQLVFLCVGTEKITGDLVGPMVGSMLNNLINSNKLSNIKIYGTLKENINFENALNIISLIEKNHKESCMIVIDSALSKKEYIGNIFVTDKKIVLGSSLNKNEIEVGDIGIKVVVGQNYNTSKLNYWCLNNISDEFIFNISKTVSNGIYKVIKHI